MWSKQFWKDAAERGVKTAAQTLILLWVSDGALDLFQVNWQEATGVALGSVALSLLTSIGSASFGDRGTASVVSEVKYQPKTPV